MGVHDLHCDSPSEHALFSAIDATHTAHPDELEDVITLRQSGADEFVAGILLDRAEWEAARGTVLRIESRLAPALRTSTERRGLLRYLGEGEAHGVRRRGDPNCRSLADFLAASNSGSGPFQRHSWTKRRIPYVLPPLGTLRAFARKGATEMDVAVQITDSCALQKGLRSVVSEHVSRRLHFSDVF